MKPEELIHPILDAWDQVQAETGLSPVEISFLRYIDGKTEDKIALYWKDDSRISLDLAKQRFLTRQYAKYAVSAEKVLKVTQLKDLLAAKGLKKTGKKADLLQRFHEAYTSAEIESLGLPKVHLLTPRGRKLVDSYPLSLSNDHTADAYFLGLLAEGKYIEAYQGIASYELVFSLKEDKDDLRSKISNAEINLSFLKARISGIEQLKVYEDQTMNALYIAMHLYSFLFGPRLTKEYVQSWMPYFYQPASDQQIKDTCEKAQNEYKDFVYQKDIVPDTDVCTNRQEFFDACDEKTRIYDTLITYFDLATAYELAGRIDKAIPCWEALVALNDPAPVFYAKLFELYDHYGMKQAAKRIEKRWKTISGEKSL